jgi:hypothetical protein
MDQKRKEEDEKQRAYNESRPGHVPDGVGVVTIGQIPEWDNMLFRMTFQWFYRSPLMNTVYACHTAVDAARHEMETGRPYQTLDNRRLYAIVHRGFPMNPREVHKLAQLVVDTHQCDADCIEGFRLHRKFHRLSRLLTPELRD